MEDIITSHRIVLCSNLFDVFDTFTPEERESYERLATKPPEDIGDNPAVIVGNTFWLILRITGTEPPRKLQTIQDDIAIFIETANRLRKLHVQPLVCWTSTNDTYCHQAQIIAQTFRQPTIVVDKLT